MMVNKLIELLTRETFQPTLIYEYKFICNCIFKQHVQFALKFHCIVYFCKLFTLELKRQNWYEMEIPQSESYMFCMPKDCISYMEQLESCLLAHEK